MASRAEPVRAVHEPLRPGVRAAIRASLSDFYFNSLRLVAMNVVWGLAVVLAVVLALAWPLGALLVAPLLAIPAAAVFRLAALIARGDTTVAIRGLAGLYRENLPTTLTLGVAFVIAAVVLGTNLVTGLASSEPLGLIVGTLAGWGLVALWCGALVVWPLVVDPARAGVPIGDTVRLAAVLLLSQPGRFGALGLAAAVMTAMSLVLTVAILTVGVSFIALVACRVVYPSADRLPLTAGSWPDR